MYAEAADEFGGGEQVPIVINSRIGRVTLGKAIDAFRQRKALAECCFFVLGAHRMDLDLVAVVQELDALQRSDSYKMSGGLVVRRVPRIALDLCAVFIDQSQDSERWESLTIPTALLQTQLMTRVLDQRRNDSIALRTCRDVLAMTKREMCNFATAAKIRLPWRPNCHYYFPRSFHAVVKTLLAVHYRQRDGLGRLPHDVLLLVIGKAAEDWLFPWSQ